MILRSSFDCIKYDMISDAVKWTMTQQMTIMMMDLKIVMMVMMDIS